MNGILTTLYTDILQTCVSYQCSKVLYKYCGIHCRLANSVSFQAINGITLAYVHRICGLVHNHAYIVQPPVHIYADTSTKPMWQQTPQHYHSQPAPKLRNSSLIHTLLHHLGLLALGSPNEIFMQPYGGVLVMVEIYCQAYTSRRRKQGSPSILAPVNQRRGEEYYQWHLQRKISLCVSASLWICVFVLCMCAHISVRKFSNAGYMSKTVQVLTPILFPVSWRKRWKWS